MKKQPTKTDATKPQAPTPQGVNLFAAAKPSGPLVPEKAIKKNKKHTVVFGTELDQIASIDAMKDALDAKRAILEQAVKAKIRSTFIGLALEQKGQPDNFVGESSIATASCELRKRSTKSPLTAPEVEVLTGLGVPIGKNVELDIPERFYFNEEILALGETVLQKISVALSTIPELKGLEIIKRQDAQHKKTDVTTDETIPAICRLPRDKMEVGLDIAAVLALKPKLRESTSIEKAYDELRAVIMPKTKTEIVEA